MKPKFLILILTVTAFIFSCKKENKNNINTDSNEQKQENTFNLKQGKHCYQYIMDNSYKKDGRLVAEKDYININFSLNNKTIEGDYIITSNKEKINNGHFTGNIEDNIITTIHTYKNDNNVFKDELIFKVFPDKIAILGGEKKLVNGINMFVDKSNCDYMMELSKTNCN